MIPRLNINSLFAFHPGIDTDLQRFFYDTFVDSDSDDDQLEFEGFTKEDICGRPIHLVNSGHDGEVVADTHAGWANVDGDGPTCPPFTLQVGNDFAVMFQMTLAL